MEFGGSGPLIWVSGSVPVGFSIVHRVYDDLGSS